MSRITVLRSNKTKPEGKNYSVVELAYKTEDGKTKGMKIFGFGPQKENADVAGSAQPGDVLEAAFQQNQKGYWEFQSLKRTGDKEPVASPAGATTNAGATKGNWETSEERAAKQIYIVRQSSVSSAIEFIQVSKTKPTVENVLDVAKQFEAYVFGKEQQQPSGEAAVQGDVE